MTRKTHRLVGMVVSGAALAGTMGMVAATPAQAFTNDGSLTASGTTYKVHAYSCNLYFRSCSWDTSMSISKSKSFTHRSDVKANGIGVKITISADPSASISGNSTSLATAKETGTGRSNKTAGVAKPSIFSVSVASQSRLAAGGISLSSGWTTW